MPLYLQLKQLLLAGIEAGRWKPGERFPGDDELARAHQISRTTVRQAMKELELAGLITRHRGRGTFLVEPKLSHAPEPPHRLTDKLEARGIRPGWKLLEARTIPAPASISAALGIAVGAPVFFSRRLRLAGEEAIGLVTAHALIQAEWVSLQELEHGPSLHYLAGIVSLAGARAERSVEAVAAGSEEVRFLGIEAGAPILRVRRILSDARGTPMEHYVGAYRGDRFQYMASGDVHAVEMTSHSEIGDCEIAGN